MKNEKIKVLNIKTGRTVSMFPHVYEGLVKAGKGKDFDLVEGAEASAPEDTKEDTKPEEDSNNDSNDTSTAEIPTVDTNEDGFRSAKEMIDAIRQAETVEAVNVLIDGEDRKTVLKAAAERKNALNN